MQSGRTTRTVGAVQTVDAVLPQNTLLNRVDLGPGRPEGLQLFEVLLDKVDQARQVLVVEALCRGVEVEVDIAGVPGSTIAHA